MIHDTNNEQISALDNRVNPFYLLFSDDGSTNMPLPKAVKLNIEEACRWRDAWEYRADIETKAYCLYHPHLRNWIGRAEDGEDKVLYCHEYYHDLLV